MKIFILIVYMYTGAYADSSVALTTAEFHSQEACLKAGQQYMQMIREVKMGNFVCTSKG